MEPDERMFLDLDTEFTVYKFFLCPIAVYLFWLTLYFVFNFIVAAERIKERNYMNLYIYYMRTKLGA